MTLLLDTHVWIWAEETPEQLGRRARLNLEDATNGVAISAMAAMEIARLVFLRRLRLAEPAARWIEDSIHSLGAVEFDVSSAIAAEAYAVAWQFS